MLDANNNVALERRVLPDLSAFMDCRTASQMHVIELRRQSEVQKQRLQNNTHHYQPHNNSNKAHAG